MTVKYDVIVVGSGSTGGALAGRLSEDSSRQVLILKGGPVYATADGMPTELLSPASIGAAAPGHPNNWTYPAEVRAGLGLPYPRGKGLGGSSSINGCYFICGTTSLPAEAPRTECDGHHGRRTSGRNDGWLTSQRQMGGI